MKRPIIDIGANLMHRQFEQDREEMIQRASNDNIEPIIITGTNIRESKKAASYIGRGRGGLFCTAGIHPHDAKTCNDTTIQELKKLAALPQVVAIGECGLDYDRDFSPRDIQKNWFIKQIELAKELDMPLFLHERAAFTDFKDILSNYRELCEKAVVHCFTGSEKELKGYLELGCSIGITGWICDERRGVHLRSLIKQIPLNRLMIETDAPFLLPRNMKNKPDDRRNEPIFLRHILNDIAKSIGKDADELADITYNNTIRFFGIETQK